VPQGPSLASAASKEMIAAAIKEGELSWLDAIIVLRLQKRLRGAFKKEYGLPDSFKFKHERLATVPYRHRGYVRSEGKQGYHRHLWPQRFRPFLQI